MKTSWLILPAVALGLFALAAPVQAVDHQPLLVNGLGGDLNVSLSLPAGCGNVNQTTGIAQGFLAVTPALGIDVGGGARSFTLTRADVLFGPFKVTKTCYGQTVGRDYKDLTVRLGQAVTFKALPSSPGVYPLTIPMADLLVHEQATVDGVPDANDSRPVQDVTGILDLAHGTVQLHLVFASKVHVPVLDEDRTATLTVNIGGRITFPDTDGDGLPDPFDNCKLVANPDQAPVATPVIQPFPSVALASCMAKKLAPPFAVDVCDLGPIKVTGDAPATFPPGRSVLTWTAVDTQGRTARAAQAVTVTDATAPVFTSIPGDVALSDCSPATLALPTAIDDCGGMPTFANDAPARFLPGQTTVTWTATDDAGNRATATQAVTVTDRVAPTVSCLPPRPTRFGTPELGFFRTSAADHCTLATVRLGGYALTRGETVNIAGSDIPGVRLVGTISGIRYFEAGPGEAVIAATDGSGNVAQASCE